MRNHLGLTDSLTASIQHVYINFDNGFEWKSTWFSVNNNSFHVCSIYLFWIFIRLSFQLEFPHFIQHTTHNTLRTFNAYHLFCQYDIICSSKQQMFSRSFTIFSKICIEIQCTFCVMYAQFDSNAKYERYFIGRLF